VWMRGIVAECDGFFEVGKNDYDGVGIEGVMCEQKWAGITVQLCVRKHRTGAGNERGSGKTMSWEDNDIPERRCGCLPLSFG